MSQLECMKSIILTEHLYYPYEIFPLMFMNRPAWSQLVKVIFIPGFQFDVYTVAIARSISMRIFKHENY